MQIRFTAYASRALASVRQLITCVAHDFDAQLAAAEFATERSDRATGRRI